MTTLIKFGFKQTMKPLVSEITQLKLITMNKALNCKYANFEKASVAKLTMNESVLDRDELDIGC